MRRRIELARGRRLEPADVQRSGGIDSEVLGVAQRIIDDVKARGDEALFDYTSQFDHAKIADLRVSAEEIELALAEVGDEFREAIATAARSSEDFHWRPIAQSWFTTVEGGV